MTIIVEDGTLMDTVSPQPNSYVSVADTDFYFVTTRFDTVWEDADDEQKELSIIKGAEYLQQKWRLIWKGSRIRGFQPMDWPRSGVSVPDFFDPFFRNAYVPFDFRNTLYVPENEVPQEVRDAQMMLARESMDDGGVSSLTLQEMLTGRTAIREKLGPLEVEYMAAEQGAAANRLTNVYWNAAKRIEPFLRPNQPNTGGLVRG